MFLPRLARRQLSSSFPNALVGFIALLHLYSNLCSEHFCPRLFILVFFQDSQSSTSGSNSTCALGLVQVFQQCLSPPHRSPCSGVAKMLLAPCALLGVLNHHFAAEDIHRHTAGRGL